MFTGIVEELGAVVDFVDLGDAAHQSLHGALVTGDARSGDSISVNGVCLTVVDIHGETFTADVMKETLDRSSLASLRPGDPVNLERAATLGTRLGGHLVAGHVDGVGTVLGSEAAQQWEFVRIGLSPELARYMVEKGSIAVDGVSLTVVEVTDEAFTVSLIPATLKLTTFGSRSIGDSVNLEVDVIAKYVEKLMAAGHE
jgi:riboflavin synthase